MESDKILVAFDFDHTLIKHQSYAVLEQIIPNYESVIKSIKSQVPNWFEYNVALMKEFKERGFKTKHIKEHIETLELNENFKLLLDHLKANQSRFKVVIMSGTINMIIKWVLTYQGYSEMIQEIYSNKCVCDEEDFLEYLNNNAVKCEECKYSLCKAKIMKTLLDENKFKKVLYVGDGINDYCPAVHMRESDVLYARKDFGLHKKLYENKYVDNLKCTVVSWDCGKNIYDHLLELNI